MQNCISAPSSGGKGRCREYLVGGLTLFANRCHERKIGNEKGLRGVNPAHGDQSRSFELTFIYLFYLALAAACSINSATSFG
jgi:hypothetical protein